MGIRLRAPVTVIEPNAGPGGINVEVQKWGFIDGSGKWVAPAVWDAVADFHEGLAGVKKDTRIGFIDLNGNVVIEPTWDPGIFGEVGISFSDGLASVEHEKKFGFIDTQGKVVIPLQFDFACNFSEGMAVVKQNGKWSFIDKKGNVAIASSSGWDEAGSFHHGIASIEKRGPDEEHVISGNMKFKGYLDKTGKVISPCQWDWAGGYSEGLGRVFKGDGADRKAYFLDETGKIVLEPKCVNVDVFHEGLAAIEPNTTSGYGFMDKSGKMVISPRWREAKPFSCGLAAVVDEKRLTGFIDRTGKVVMEPKWEGVYGFEEGMCRVQSQGGLRYGIIDTTGKVLIPPEWDKLEIENGYCFAQRETDPVQGESYAWFDKTGKMIWHSIPGI